LKKIILNRKTFWVSYVNKYKVFIDGKELKPIINDEQQEYIIDTNNKSVLLSIRTTTFKKYKQQLELTNGEAMNLIITTTPIRKIMDLSFWLTLLICAILPKITFLWLIPVSILILSLFINDIVVQTDFASNENNSNM